MIGAFLLEGMIIDKIDFDNEILYIQIPKESYSYLKPDSKIKCADDFAKRIKTVWIELGIFSDKGKVKYKERNIKWTEELGNENYNKNIGYILKMI